MAITHRVSPRAIAQTLLREPLSSAQSLVLTAAQVTLPEAARIQMKTIAEAMNPEEWAEAVRFADAHGLASLLWHHLVREDLHPLLPLSIAEHLHQGYHERLLTQLRLAHTLKLLIAHCRESGIAVLPFKGVTLGERLYSNLGLRPSVDLDVLIAPHISQRRAYHALAAQFATCEARHIRIELGWDIVRRPPYQSVFPRAAIWERSQMTTFRGLPCRQLALADELRYLCTHCALHSFKRLIWLVDIAELLHKTQEEGDWSWSHFAQDTINGGVAFPVAACLIAAQQWLHASAPDDALAMLAEAATTPQEQARWATLQEPHLFVHRGVLALRSTASFAERWQLAHTTFWPDLAYLYDNADWSPGHSALLARLYRLQRIVRRGLHRHMP